MGNAHSDLSPSAANRWMACPGSVRECRKVPKLPTGESAAEGTVAHALCEQFVEGEIDSLELMGRIGETVTESGHEIEITEEMVDAVIEYADLCKADIAKISGMGRPLPVIAKTEVRVKVDLGENEELWGTADRVTYQKGNTLIVRDFKFGYNVVEVENNPQLAIYAIGVMDQEAGWAFDEVRLAVFQPRARHEDGSDREWVTTPGELKEWKRKLKSHVEDTMADNAPVVAGSHCRWCAAKIGCPAVNGAIAEAAQADFSTAPSPETAKKDVGTLVQEARTWPTRKIANILEWEEPIKAIIEAAKDVAREMLSSGLEVPGFKLVDGRSNRKWIDEDDVVAEFDGVLGTKLWEKKLLSPAKLEKLVGKGKIDHLTFKPEAQKAIARDTDPRRPALTSAQEDFKEVPTADPLVDELMGETQPTKKKIWA
ncbi:MAG: DUF2800 domain-containing protein [Patescibacteria group bacterium]|nr:DUF2800 domain-containing protein [Patescibacteria group bacterium]